MGYRHANLHLLIHIVIAEFPAVPGIFLQFPRDSNNVTTSLNKLGKFGCVETAGNSAITM